MQRSESYLFLHKNDLNYKMLCLQMVSAWTGVLSVPKTSTHLLHGITSFLVWCLLLLIASFKEFLLYLLIIYLFIYLLIYKQSSHHWYAIQRCVWVDVCVGERFWNQTSNHSDSVDVPLMLCLLTSALVFVLLSSFLPSLPFFPPILVPLCIFFSLSILPSLWPYIL